MRRRAPTDEEVQAARRRLAAISGRPKVAAAQQTGWVPQVPTGVHAVADASPGRGNSAFDQLPLGLRAVVESLPAGMREARMGLESGHAVVILLVVLLGLAVAALLLGIGRPRVEPVGSAVAATVVATGTPASGVGRSEPEPEDGAPAELVVHVAGKVRTPGVVRLPPGSRVLDAVDAAGGATQGADLTGLNLARPLTDGEQVLVGVPAPTGAAVPETPGAAPGPINLNTATSDQLEELPGIGPALAGRILAWRDEHGRFTSVEELQEVSGIGPAILAELADLITV
jgi:competence protein ComEA